MIHLIRETRGQEKRRTCLIGEMSRDYHNASLVFIALTDRLITQYAADVTRTNTCRSWWQFHSRKSNVRTDSQANATKPQLRKLTVSYWRMCSNILEIPFFTLCYQEWSSWRWHHRNKQTITNLQFPCPYKKERENHRSRYCAVKVSKWDSNFNYFRCNL